MRLLPKRFHPATLDDLAAAKQRILRPARAAYHFLVRVNSWLARNNMPTWVPFKHFNKLFKSVAAWNLERQLATAAKPALVSAGDDGSEVEGHMLKLGRIAEASKHLCQNTHRIAST
jgi:hypothetical protein